MYIAVLPPGDPGVFRPLLLPETARALAAGEPVSALALMEGDLALGVLAGYLEDGIFRITSLYVSPHYRRCGGGRMLMDALTEALRGFAHTVTADFTLTQADHGTLLPYLEVMGFEPAPVQEQTVYLTTLARIAATPFFSAKGAEAGRPLSQLSAAELSVLKTAAARAGAPLPEGGFQADCVDPDVSMAAVRNGEAHAFAVLDRSWPGGLTLSGLWSSGKYPLLLPGVLRSVLSRLLAHYPPDTKLALQAVNPTSAALLRGLIPDADAVSYTYYRDLTRMF